MTNERQADMIHGDGPTVTAAEVGGATDHGREACRCGHVWADHYMEPAADGRTGCSAARGLARCDCPKEYRGDPRVPGDVWY